MLNLAVGSEVNFDGVNGLYKYCLHQLHFLIFGLNGVFGNGGMDSMYQEMLDQVRTELSQLGVSLPKPNLTTANILKSIAEIEVERALNSAIFKPENPLIRKFDA